MLLIFLGLILIISFYTDLFKRKIYNWVSLGGAIVGLLYNIYYFGFSGFYMAALGWLVGIILFAIPYSLGGMGAGDAKILGTVGAFMGPGFVWNTFLVTALLGGLYASGILIYRRSFFNTAKISFVGLGLLLFSGFKVNTLPDMDNGQVPDTIPYGALVSVSVLIIIYWGGVTGAITGLT